MMWFSLYAHIFVKFSLSQPEYMTLDFLHEFDSVDVKVFLTHKPSGRSSSDSRSATVSGTQLWSSDSFSRRMWGLRVWQLLRIKWQFFNGVSDLCESLHPAKPPAMAKAQRLGLIKQEDIEGGSLFCSPRSAPSGGPDIV